MIYIIGIGPGGDTGYLTLKALKVIEAAEIGIYIGEMIGEDFKSLFKNKKLFTGKINNQKVLSIIETAYSSNKGIALLMPGDSSFYSGQYLEQFTLSEYVTHFEQSNYKYEVIPGISALNAICAISKIDLTSFTNSQNVFVTSIERLRDLNQFDNKELAKTFSSKPNLVLYQSYRDWYLIKKLITVYYSPKTRVIFAYKVSWKDEKIVESTIESIDKVLNNIELPKHTIIVIIPER